MLVEDDHEIRQLMAEILDLLDHEVLEAENGQEGLRAYESGDIDLVLSDIQMPIMNGLEMARRILEYDARARIVFVSAFNEQQYRDAAKDLGIETFISKPVKLDEIVAVIKKVAA